MSMNVNKFVFEIFLRLTSKTCPYGYEDDLMKELVSSKVFPDTMKIDTHGNYYHTIGNSRTIFASHLDTVSKEYVSVTHVLDGKYIRTDGKTTLGADDKAGVTIMLWMMKNNIPGTYYFFIGEEVGCVGSGLAAKYGKFKGEYDRIVSFDRRDTGSVITYQSCGRCCSDTFADALCAEFNNLGMSYKKDDGGVYTDSAEFVDLIPECTNISVGYYKEHTMQENQDIEHLTRLADACIKVNWDSLPVDRDPSVKETRSYYDDYDYGNYSGYNNMGSYSSRSKQSRSWRDRDRTSYAYFNENAYRKTRRSEKKDKSSKTYYDSAGTLIEITKAEEVRRYDDKSKGSENKYSWILYKFLDAKFTWEELQIVKDQFLNMEEGYDRYFYDYLKENVVEC